MIANRGGGASAPAICVQHARERAVEHDVGQRRQMIGEALDGEPAAQVLRQQAERLRMLEVAQHVHLVLGVAGCAREQARELVAPRVPVRLGQQHARVEQLVEQQRMARQVVGGPRRRAHQVGEARQQRRMLDHQREIRAAPATASSSASSRSNTDLRAGSAGMRGRDGEELRHQRVEALPRRARAAAGSGRSRARARAWRAARRDRRIRLRASRSRAVGVGRGSLPERRDMRVALPSRVRPRRRRSART